jgi:hypothetical protein
MMNSLEEERPVELVEVGGPSTVLDKLTSRKLILGAFTIAGIVGLWIGTALVEPSLFETARNELRIAMALIAGVGGSGAFLQYVIDKNGR